VSDAAGIKTRSSLVRSAAIVMPTIETGPSHPESACHPAAQQHKSATAPCAAPLCLLWNWRNWHATSARTTAQVACCASPHANQHPHLTRACQDSVMPDVLLCIATCWLALCHVSSKAGGSAGQQTPAATPFPPIGCCCPEPPTLPIQNPKPLTLRTTRCPAALSPVAQHYTFISQIAYQT
jgi:hypothetical protein